MSSKPLLISNGHGGARANSGPRPSWFREEMQDLIKKLSPKLCEFAEKTFNGEFIDPVVTRQGVVYVEASVHDKTVLMMALAKLAGFVDNPESPLREPLQKVIDQVQAIKLMQELNYGTKPAGAGNGSETVVGNGHPETPPQSPSAPAV